MRQIRMRVLRCICAPTAVIYTDDPRLPLEGRVIGAINIAYKYVYDHEGD